MNAARLAMTEWRRLMSGARTRAAVLAMLFVPAVCGGLYVYANHDPYQNLRYVPAALVVEDLGATRDGQPVNAGSDVADALVSGAAFDWHRVSADQAAAGVDSGSYDFALTIPRDFSKAVTSATTFDPRQAQLVMTTNDAHTYLSRTIAAGVTDQVRAALSSKVGTEAAANFLLGLSETRSGLLSAATSAATFSDSAVAAHDGTASLAQGSTDLADSATALAAGIDDWAKKATAMPERTKKLATAAQDAGTSRADAATAADAAVTSVTRLQTRYAKHRDKLIAAMTQAGLQDWQQQQVLAVYDDLGTSVTDTATTVTAAGQQVDDLATASDAVSTTATKLAEDATALVAGIKKSAKAGDKLSGVAAKLSDGATETSDGLGLLKDGAVQLHAGLRNGAEQIPQLDAATRDRIAATIGSPVAIQSASTASAPSYGAGQAPFFLAVAAWVGGYALFLLVRPLSRRAVSANQGPLRVALGGWLTPAAVGAAQMCLLGGTVLLAVQVPLSHVPSTIAFLVLVSATFIALVHVLNAWFGTVGQFAGLGLVALQMVAVGSTFPWQTIPQPLHWLHYAMPMTYAVDGLRQLMYGGPSPTAAGDAVVLALFLVLALLVSATAALHKRTWTVRRLQLATT